MGLDQNVYFYKDQRNAIGEVEYSAILEIDARAWVQENSLKDIKFKDAVHKQLIETLEDRLEKMITMKRVDKLKELRDVQCSDGNWNLTEYMRGLANGLILAVSIFDEQEPKFKEEQ